MIHDLFFKKANSRETLRQVYTTLLTGSPNDPIDYNTMAVLLDILLEGNINTDDLVSNSYNVVEMLRATIETQDLPEQDRMNLEDVYVHKGSLLTSLMLDYRGTAAHWINTLPGNFYSLEHADTLEFRGLFDTEEEAVAEARRIEEDETGPAWDY